MWSYWLGKIKESISNSDRIAEALGNELDPVQGHDFNRSYFFTKIGRWQHLIELFVASHVLALVIALAEAQAWSRLDVLKIFHYVLFINWILIAFAVVISCLKNKLRKLNMICALILSFIILQIIILVTTLLLNVLSYWGQDHFFEHFSFISLLDQLGLNLAYGVLLGAFCLRYLYVLEQWYRQQHGELNARIQAMQARIQPHFLFNSLNSAISLISIDPDKAERVILNLSKLFRASFQEFRLVSLQEELDLCKKYIAIEEIRLGDRLKVEWKLPENEALKQVKIPLLTLQPLLENSIFHGVEKKIVGDSIGVLVEILKNQVTIVITNPSTMGKIKSRQGHGIALENVKQRLKAHFGSSLQFQSHLANGFFTILIRYQYK